MPSFITRALILFEICWGGALCPSPPKAQKLKKSPGEIGLIAPNTGRLSYKSNILPPRSSKSLADSAFPKTAAFFIFFWLLVFLQVALQVCGAFSFAFSLEGFCLRQSICCQLLVSSCGSDVFGFPFSSQAYFQAFIRYVLFCSLLCIYNSSCSWHYTFCQRC